MAVIAISIAVQSERMCVLTITV